MGKIIIDEMIRYLRKIDDFIFLLKLFFSNGYVNNIYNKHINSHIRVDKICP